jgi:hypothetical protein
MELLRILEVSLGGEIKQLECRCCVKVLCCVGERSPQMGLDHLVIVD